MAFEWRNPKGKQGINGKAFARLDNTFGVPTFVLNKDISGAGTTTVVENSQFKFRVIDAWSIGTSADGGTWKVTDGTNDIVPAVTQAANDKDVDRAVDIDDAHYTIIPGEDLKIVSTGASLACTVYILCARV